MEIIPITLAGNAGMDALNIMAELKAKHNTDNVRRSCLPSCSYRLQGKKFGVDVYGECVADMSEQRVWEPLLNKQAQCV